MSRKAVPTLWLQVASLLFALLVFPARGASLPPGFIDVVVATGFTNVSTLGIAPDGRVFACQQNGTVRVVKDGAVLPTPFITLQVNSVMQRGLTGIAFDPGFSTNNFIYFHYTTNAVGGVVQRISRFVANGDVVAAGSETPLIETDVFTDDQEVGGGIGFGADGMLYVGIGQCGLSASVQVTNTLFGKILRLMRDGTIPADNPFFGVNTGKNRAVWALGFRNPFVMSFQRSNGRHFINDVGSANTVAREEINEAAAGANFGWPVCEGSCSPSNAAYRDAIYYFTHTNSFVAITGGTFYDPPSPLFPAQYVGKYFFGDYATATIQLLDPATRVASLFASGLSGNLVSLQVGPEGALYYLVQSTSPNGGGIVGKIIPGVQTLVPFGSTWKYLDTGITSIAATWTQSAFDDSTWSNGVAQLGWGPNGEVTLIRSNRTDNSRITTTYFRKAFTLTNSAPYSNYVVSLLRDDGGIVYLNGTEVFRSNMPTGTIASSTFATLAVASTDERVTHGAIVNPSLLVNGTNLLAVEIHQSATNAATDMSFDLGLFGVPGNADLKAALSGPDIAVFYPSWANRFVLEAAPELPSVNWAAVTNASTTVGNSLRVIVPPVGNRFFRLRSP